MSEIITIDSDDEDYAAAAPSAPAPLTSNPARSFHSPQHQPRPGPSNPSLLTAMGGKKVAPKIPKKPGPFPPFVLFSQEHRPQIVKANPYLSFADAGRQLGEMWHALSEVEKNGYRERARALQEKRVKDWTAKYGALAAKLEARASAMQLQKLKLAQQQQQQMQQQRMQQPTQAMPNRNRKMHGYAVFANEVRPRLLASGLTMGECSQRIALLWRQTDPKRRRMYEVRAAKMNQAVDQRLVAHQQRTGLHQPGGQQQQQQHRAMPNSQRLNRLPSGTSLKISSVSSLSNTAQASRSPLNLPSSISISRVEPEVSIVAEQANAATAAPNLRQLPAGTQLTVQRGGQRGRPMNLPPPPSLTRGVRMPANRMVRGGGRGMLPLRGRPIMPKLPLPNSMGPMIRPANSMRGMVAGLKRPMMPGVRGVVPPPMKRLRPSNTPQSKAMLEFQQTLGPSVPVTQLDESTKMCRLCANTYPATGPVYALDTRPELVEKIRESLGIALNLAEDKAEGYPGVVCRKCASMVTNFANYKKTILGEASVTMSRYVAMRKSQLSQISNHDDIAAPEGEAESILPDLEQPEFVTVDGPVPQEELMKIKKEPANEDEKKDAKLENGSKDVEGTDAAQAESKEKDLEEEDRSQDPGALTAGQEESNDGLNDEPSMDGDNAPDLENEGDQNNGGVEGDEDACEEQTDHEVMDETSNDFDAATLNEASNGETDDMSFLQIGDSQSIADFDDETFPSEADDEGPNTDDAFDAHESEGEGLLEDSIGGQDDPDFPSGKEDGLEEDDNEDGDSAVVDEESILGLDDLDGASSGPAIAGGEDEETLDHDADGVPHGNESQTENAPVPKESLEGHESHGGTTTADETSQDSGSSDDDDDDDTTTDDNDTDRGNNRDSTDGSTSQEDDEPGKDEVVREDAKKVEDEQDLNGLREEEVAQTSTDEPEKSAETPVEKTGVAGDGNEVSLAAAIDSISGEFQPSERPPSPTVEREVSEQDEIARIEESESAVESILG